MSLTKRFDWRLWNPAVCSTAEEIDDFLAENEIYGKPIKKQT